MEDSKTRFSRTVDDYDRYRPDYPDAALDWLAETTGVRPPATVIDLGAGTGISTRWLAARGYDAVGVEPNGPMRERAEERGGRYREGTAAAIPAPAASADLVLACQAFHWFELDAALPEIARVLRVDGWAAAFWNLRERDDAFAVGYDATLGRFSAEIHQVDTGDDVIPRLAAHRLTRDVVEAVFPHHQALDEAGLIGRAASSSYVQHGVADRVGLDQALRELFAEHAVDGRVKLRYRTRCAAWRPAS